MRIQNKWELNGKAGLLLWTSKRVKELLNLCNKHLNWSNNSLGQKTLKKTHSWNQILPVWALSLLLDLELLWVLTFLIMMISDKNMVSKMFILQIVCQKWMKLSFWIQKTQNSTSNIRIKFHLLRWCYMNWWVMDVVNCSRRPLMGLISIFPLSRIHLLANQLICITKRMKIGIVFFRIYLNHMKSAELIL